MGNEPDLWKVKVPISQLAADAVTLKKVLTSGRYSIGTDVYGSSFAGIEASEASAYLPGARAAITGFTAHDYPYARNCNLASCACPGGVLHPGRPASPAPPLRPTLPAPRRRPEQEVRHGRHGAGDARRRGRRGPEWPAPRDAPRRRGDRGLLRRRCVRAGGRGCLPSPAPAPRRAHRGLQAA